MASLQGSSSSRCRSLGLLFLGLCLLSVSQLTYAQDNGETNTDGNTGPTTLESFHIDLTHEESTTSSIMVNWKVPSGYDITRYEVISKRTSSNATRLSGALPINEGLNQYLVEDLKRDTEYEVCIRAEVRTEDGEETSEEECEVFATVPLVRADSLIILFCVLGYIVLMILIGYLVYRSHKKRILAEMEEKEEEEEKMKTNEKPQSYFVAPSQNAPKSSIEDHDIPFITPPVEQLSPREKEQYKKALTNWERKLQWWYNT